MAQTRHAAAGTAAPPESLPLDSPTWIAIAAQWELSPQQTRIVELLLLGQRDKQIACELRLSIPTVRTYLGRIFLKVGVQDRVDLILQVFRAARSIESRHQRA